jgi:hypothetical protein
MLHREVSMRWLAVIVLLVPSVADAGKKDKKKKKAEEPAAETLVALPCNYVPGAAHRYRYEKVTRKDLPTGTTARTTRYELGIEIVSFDGSTSVMDVTQGPMEVEGSDPTDPMQEAMVKALGQSGTPMPVARYAMNHLLNEGSVLNMDEVLPAYQAVTADALDVVRGTDPATADMLEPLILSLMTPELVTQAINDDVAPLLDFACGEFRPFTTYETQLPNALGGDPFPAHGTVTLTRKGEDVVVDLVETIDPASAAPLLRSILVGAGVPEGSAELEKALASMEIHVSTDLEIVTPAATGWPTTWTSERVAKVSMDGNVMPGGRTDTVRSTRVVAD